MVAVERRQMLAMYGKRQAAAVDTKENRVRARGVDRFRCRRADAALLCAGAVGG